jgi:hypothetical protein
MKTKLLLLLTPFLLAFNCTPDEVQEYDCLCRLETFEYRTQFINGMPVIRLVLVNPGEFEPNDCSLAELGWLETNNNQTEQKWNCVTDYGD